MKYKVAKVVVTGAEARAVDRRPITRGMTGTVVEFEYRDPMWNGLKKLVVFEGYSEPVGFLAGTNLVVLPWEVTTQIGAWVKVGVYGEDATGATVIPTIWAELGSVQSAPDGKFNPPGTPSPSIWAQILAMIGDLDDLETKARENLVAAINEAMKTGEGGVGGYYTPVVSSPEAGVMRVSFVPSQEGMEPIAAVDIPLPAGRDGKDGADGKDGQDGAPGESGVYTLAEGESIEDVPESATVVVDPYGEAEEEPGENTGTDISLGVSGASVGQVVKIAAVDENGVPTAWEPVEMAGEEIWERCRYFEVPSASGLSADTSGITWFADEENNVYGFEITTTDQGNEFAYKNLYIKVRQGASAGANKSATIYINDVKIGEWTTAQINLVNRTGRAKIERMGAGFELSWNGLGAAVSTGNWVGSATASNGAEFANGNYARVDGNIEKIKFICSPENYFPSGYLVGIWGEL